MTLQNKMFCEMKEKFIFELAKECAFDYANNSLLRNVFPTSEAIRDLNQFEENMPVSTGEALSIIKQLHQYGSPASVMQIGGRYFGLVNGGIVPVSLAVKWLTDFWDQNTPLYVTSPIVSKLEEVTEKWLIKLFGLPIQTVAGFVSGSSMSIFCGLAAARYRILKNNNWDVNAKGLNGSPRIRVVAGNQAHATVKKAIALLGLGVNNVEWVEVNDQGSIISSAIPELDNNTLLILQAGNVNSGSFDRFDEICEKARKSKAWIHIDGAFGLWASASNKLSHLTSGINLANSWSVDGHKTLNTPYDSGIVLCDDKEALVNALHATGSYITYSEHRDGMLYTPEMSRRARVIELWATMKYLGRQGIDELVYSLHERAVQFSKELRENCFTILNDVVFNQVLVACETDELTKKIIPYIQQSGECWVGGSKWKGRDVIRISVCSWATTEEDVSRSVQIFCKAKKDVNV